MDGQAYDTEESSYPSANLFNGDLCPSQAPHNWQEYDATRASFASQEPSLYDTWGPYLFHNEAQSSLSYPSSLPAGVARADSIPHPDVEAQASLQLTRENQTLAVTTRQFHDEGPPSTYNSPRPPIPQPSTPLLSSLSGAPVDILADTSHSPFSTRGAHHSATPSTPLSNDLTPSPYNGTYPIFSAEQPQGVSPSNTTLPIQHRPLCHHCNDYPNGFRTMHELRRHVKTAHGESRKGWVIVHNLEMESMLKIKLRVCEACRTQKKYRREDSAAAHLRRVHIHPGQGGGVSGGNNPPLWVLKRDWLREVPLSPTSSTPFPGERSTFKGPTNGRERGPENGFGNMTALDDHMETDHLNYCMDVSLTDALYPSLGSSEASQAIPRSVISPFSLQPAPSTSARDPLEYNWYESGPRNGFCNQSPSTSTRAFLPDNALPFASTSTIPAPFPPSVSPTALALASVPSVGDPWLDDTGLIAPVSTGTVSFPLLTYPAGVNTSTSLC